MMTQWPDSALLSRIRELLLRRRIENKEVGIRDRDNIFDTKLLCILGEELCCARYGAKRAEVVNQEDWDLIAPRGQKIQVKTRAVYRHNTDGIHIDFKALNFDDLYLVLVDEQLNILGEGLIAKKRLVLLVAHESSGKLRLRDIRRRYKEYLAFAQGKAD
ncbi:hypothetical protein K8640_23760 [Myxococcus sp. XM-1-1-1]|uniref:hypothetical protein n=1 Tax=Myxococcus sp. XM-1-1-1 TaxID=2874602 RepID=UPI001CBB8CF7|nr:hypothetical protein [Myxococcus sp. XM-1-1-1]MBZ4411234.1 hypothetical protein [Myxococcus sp. XM-1-1-1]